ncbi:MAG: hypothetical protein MN733_06420 [Nitrososphaera sp.]|nr:hypothetical protein [Nitrososphaera sp.]
MTSNGWKSIDEIIEALAGSPKVTTCPMSPDPVIMYRCDHDEYDVYYAPDLGEATYRFDCGSVIDVNHLTKGHVEYYLRSKYWKEL